MALSYFCSYCGAETTSGAQFCHACQHSLTDGNPTTQVSHVLHERYEILTRVGSGGFGAVYKARDTCEHGRVVAIKQINLKGLSSQEVIEATDAFNREAEILTALDHALLPRIFDRFHDPEHWYLVLNFIEGQTLDDYLREYAIKALPRRTGLALDEVLSIGLQLCDVLQYLHTREPAVIFRDLKPGNVMRTTSGELCLIDFGIARRFKPGQAKDTLPFGSPGFASPEQYGRTQTTPRADIYSLGALLYYLLSDDDPSEHPFQFPALSLPKVEGLAEMEELTQRMVALDVAQRPNDMQAVRHALQEIQRISRQSTSANTIWLPPTGQPPIPPGSPQQAIFFPSAPQGHITRRNLITGGLTAGVVALAGGGMLALLHSIHTATHVTPSVATAIAQDADGTYTAEENRLAAVPLYGTAYWSLDLSHAAVVNPSATQIDLYLVQGKKLLGSIKPAPSLFGSDFSQITIQWSPDNDSLALIPGMGDAPPSIWDAGRMQLRFVLPSEAANYPALFWSPDSALLAIEYIVDDDPGNSYTKLLFLEARNGKRLFEQKFVKDITADNGGLPGSTPAGILAWSPDNQYLLVPNTSFAEVAANGNWSATLWQNGTFQPGDTLMLSLPWSISQTLQTDTALYISWSPNSASIAIYYGQRIWICSLTSVKATYSLSRFNYASLTYGPTWSPDGTYLAMLLDSELYICHAFTGRTMLMDRSGLTDGLVACTWAPDSQSITVVDQNNVITRHSIG